ncbi:serine/threonine protein kinase [Nakamurella flavida]|uniref:non-specific serine/threonine protein kinase n=1 Tax=Nakamurella flavida TaxID=363630 RepID=A0A938YHJ2_9ACTN|nr:serine/threonine-protein kinase [Nakamurella flavida]MBM9474873.1 serine/threonine protein kinase [Nakamurella flavida]MDP9776443.1 hypothetical protein [Nakamurella flavida]
MDDDAPRSGRPLDGHDRYDHESDPAPSSELSVARSIGPYRLDEPLGAGASAQTWTGTDERTGRAVALKIFAPGGLAAARREATLAEIIDHPHVPHVLDVVADPDRPTLVTELATGGTLAALLARAGRLTVGQCLTVLIPLASVLATAHERRIVHGDLSTRNIVLDAVGRPLLVDLGAGHALAEGDGEVELTPCHAAPEVAAGSQPDAAADVFALGSVARACLIGEPAWPASELADVVRLADAGPWPDVPDTIGSAPLAALVRAMLRPDPIRRPGAAGLVVGLRAVGRPEPLPMPSGVGDGPEASPRAPAPAAGAQGGHATSPDAGAVHAGSAPASRSRPLGEAPDPAGAAQALTRARLRSGSAGGVDRPVPPARGSRRGGRSRRRTPAPVRRRRRAAGLVAAFVLVALTGMALIGQFTTTGAESESSGAAVALPPPTPGGVGGPGAAAASSGTGSPGASGWSSDAAAPAGATPDGVGPTDGSAAAVPTGAPVAVGGSSTTGTAALPSSGAAVAAVGAAGASGAGGGAGEAGAGPGGESVTGSAVDPGVDWLTVVRALSAERGRALSQGDPMLLDRVYVPGPARAADLATMERLRNTGATVSGAAHEIASAGVIGPVGPGTARPTVSGLPGMRLLVTDHLPSYEVQDGDGVTVGRTAARDGAALVMTVVETGEGYRIEEVATA